MKIKRAKFAVSISAGLKNLELTFIDSEGEHKDFAMSLHGNILYILEKSTGNIKCTTTNNLRWFEAKEMPEEVKDDFGISSTKKSSESIPGKKSN